MGLNLLKYGVAGLALLLVIGRFGVPHLLTGLGFHPHFEVPAMDVSGQRALIVTTSVATLGEGGKPTGVFASEMTAPYYAFQDAGMDVDIASIDGGPIPIEPMSLRWPVVSGADKRYLDDLLFQSKVARSYRIDHVDISQYDIVFLAGGWGAAYDFGASAELGRQMAAAYSNEAIIGGVCHGPLGLLQARTDDGRPIIEGRRMTAVTDKQVRELGITQTPMHPERALRAAGVVFEADTAFRDIFANTVVVDGRLVTGQNQNSATETAAAMMQLLSVQARAEPNS